MMASGGTAPAARFATRLRKFVLIAALLPSLALAQDFFGAIAYSPGTGADGWAKDHPSRRAAQRAALEGCRQHAKDCRPVVWFKNACGALAISNKAYGWGWGSTQALADAEAIKACAKHAKGCKVKRQVCTAHPASSPPPPPPRS
jgi:serine/threonine-protein kinase